MKHKHYDLIVAWAGGAKVEFKGLSGEWYPVIGIPYWESSVTYRIKPEPKPDSVKIRMLTYNAATNCVLIQGAGDAQKANIMFTFDGETGALKDAQVLAKLV